MTRANLSALLPGDIVVTSGDRADWLSRLVMWATDSAWTHVFVVKNAETLVESWFPSGVREQPLAARFAQLLASGQTYRVVRATSLTKAQRAYLVQRTQTYLGRKYDVLQAVLFGLFHVFLADGPKRVICSRFITALYADVGVDLFPAAVLDRTAGRAFSRYGELRKGWAIPQDFLEFADTLDVTSLIQAHAA